MRAGEGTCRLLHTVSTVIIVMPRIILLGRELLLLGRDIIRNVQRKTCSRYTLYEVYKNK